MKKYLVILLLLLVGCEITQINSPVLDTMRITTDKELYHSGEIIHITANINSPMELNNITIRFYGIHASRYRLDQTKIVNLYKGNNNITLDYNAPRCYGCAGINPGTYEICTDVIYNGKSLANATINVEIRQ